MRRIRTAVTGRPTRTAAVLVEGDAGGGVTTLLGEVARLGAAHHSRVLRGSVTRHEKLGLLIEAFGGTDLDDCLRNAVDPAQPADPCGRAQLARHIVEWLGASGALLVLDDVQLADPESTAVLSLLLRHSDVRALKIVLGARTGRLPVELRTACVSSDHFEVVRLPAWSASDVRLALPGQSTVRARVLCEAAQGRPAFVLAMSAMPTRELRQLERLPVAVVADRTADGSGGIWPAADHLGTVTRQVAASAALLSRDIDVEQLTTVCGLTVDRVVHALTDLTTAGVLSEDGGRLRFVHPVVRAAAYRWMTAPERVTLHRHAMSMLMVDGASVLDVADHMAISAKAGEIDVARALVAAARRRLATDPLSAERWATAAIRCVGNADDGDHLILDEARFLLAQAHAETGRAATAIQVAHDLLREGPFRSRAAVLIARCERALGRHSVARSVLLGELGTAVQDPELGAEIGLELLANAAFLPRQRSSADAAPRPASADGAGDGVERAARAILAVSTAMRHDRHTQDHRSLVAAVRVAADLVDRLPNRGFTALVEHLPVLVWCETRLDLIDRATAHAERALVTARGRDHTVAWLLIARADLALLCGELERSLELSAEAAEMGLELDLTSLVRVADAVGWRARLWTGAPLDTDVLARLSVRPDPISRFVALAGADVMHQLGHHEAARGIILPLLASLAVPRSPAGGSALTGPAGFVTDDAAHVLATAITVETSSGDLDSARALWLLARPLVDRRSGYDAATVELAGSTLACAEGHVVDGLELAHRAARGFDRVGAPLAAGRARLQAADAHRMSGDPENAHREIGVAKRSFQLHGADYLVGAAVTAQKRVAASQSRGLQPGSFGLSGREAEIAQFVCQGLTNRLIAERLFLSVRTVDSHVARVLAKVGVTSRVALLAMFPQQQGQPVVARMS